MSPVTMFSGGPPGVLPTAVANLQLWYEASVGVYEDEAATDAAEDTDEVRSWVDSQNSYKVYTVGGAGTGPAYDVDGANSRPCLTYDGVNDQLNQTTNDADDFLGTSNTGFIVAKFADATPAGVNVLVNFFDGAPVIRMLNVAAAQTWQNSNDDGTLDSVTKAVGGTLAQWRIYTFMNNGTNVYAGADDTRTASMGSAASGNTAAGANTNLYIGNTPADVVSIAEFIWYNVAVAESDRQSIEQRLAWKYGITLPY